MPVSLFDLKYFLPSRRQSSSDVEKSMPSKTWMKRLRAMSPALTKSCACCRSLLEEVRLILIQVIFLPFDYVFLSFVFYGCRTSPQPSPAPGRWAAVPNSRPGPDHLRCGKHRGPFLIRKSNHRLS